MPSTDFETRELLPPYVSPRRRNVTRYFILNKGKAPLWVSSVPEGVKVVKYILPKVQRLYYGDHDTKTQLALNHERYTKMVQDTPEVPRIYVIQEWYENMEKYDILSSLYMPHFGCGTQINTCVK